MSRYHEVILLSKRSDESSPSTVSLRTGLRVRIDGPDKQVEPLKTESGEALTARADRGIRLTARVGRICAFRDIWAAVQAVPSAEAAGVTCPHCGWNPVSRGEDGSFKCPTCTMQFWPDGEEPRKRSAPENEGRECAGCGQGIMHFEVNEAEDGKAYCSDCYDGNFAQCSSCKKDMRKGAEGTTEIGGDWFCKECPPNACEGCSENVHPDEAKECEGGTYCEECYDENCVECDDCGETMLAENAVSAFDTWFCDEHRPYSCDSCDEYIQENEMNNITAGTYCDSCYESVRERMAEDQWDEFYASHPELEEIDALQKAAEQNEDGMTPDTYVRIFADIGWDSSYGGDAWAHIAETWRDLATARESGDWTRTLVLTDHAFDLAHNNGSLFTKARPEVQRWLFRALEEKYFRDPFEYRDKLSADARKLLDAHIRYNAGGVAKWKEHMDGQVGAMKKMERAIATGDAKMADRVWKAFGLSVPMFKGRESFLDVAFWSDDRHGAQFVVEDIREFMRAGSPERLAKIMMHLSPDKCKPGSPHPAASYLWDKFVPRAIEVVGKTPGIREKMREGQSLMNAWDEFIRSAKRRHREESAEGSLAAALGAAFLKIALNQTDFYDFYALTVVDCDGLPDDMVRLCRGMKKMTLVQVSDAIMAILRRAVVREARHVSCHVGGEY